MFTPNCRLSSDLDLISRSPEEFAEVETTGRPNRRHKVDTIGCALILIATDECWPLIQFGKQFNGSGISQVVGPGQEFLRRSRNCSLSGAISSSSCSNSPATRIKPLSKDLFFNSKMRWTADSLKGSQPRPQTDSVGYATIPPFSSREQAIWGEHRLYC